MTRSNEEAETHGTAATPVMPAFRPAHGSSDAAITSRLIARLVIGASFDPGRAKSAITGVASPFLRDSV